MVISKRPRASNRNTRARGSSNSFHRPFHDIPSTRLIRLGIFYVLFFGDQNEEYGFEMTEGKLATQFRILSTQGWLYIYILPIEMIERSKSHAKYFTDHVSHSDRSGRRIILLAPKGLQLTEPCPGCHHPSQPRLHSQRQSWKWNVDLSKGHASYQTKDSLGGLGQLP